MDNKITNVYGIYIYDDQPLSWWRRLLRQTPRGHYYSVGLGEHELHLNWTEDGKIVLDADDA